MRPLSPGKCALALGTLSALAHAVWIALIASGWARTVIDAVLALHFLKIDYALMPYAMTMAGLLLVYAFSVGAISGAVLALLWNWLNPAGQRD